jgi:hypothetical protein
VQNHARELLRIVPELKDLVPGDALNFSVVPAWGVRVASVDALGLEDRSGDGIRRMPPTLPAV